MGNSKEVLQSAGSMICCPQGFSLLLCCCSACSPSKLGAGGWCNTAVPDDEQQHECPVRAPEASGLGDSCIVVVRATAAADQQGIIPWAELHCAGLQQQEGQHL
eukprot:GHUV01017978.1.p1 GENE.GHUV01017978.1~~GHUV01017978.1.p1  ORF type:complete len:104 (+),score=23.74 GHUV01017978.1:752-1063(+)